MRESTPLPTRKSAPRRRNRRSARLCVEPLEDYGVLSQSAFGFESVAFLRDAALGGGTFEFDFEPGDIKQSFRAGLRRNQRSACGPAPGGVGWE